MRCLIRAFQVVPVCAATIASAQAIFESPALPAGAEGSACAGVNGDGAVVAGTVWGPGGPRAFVWTRGGGTSPVGVLLGGWVSFGAGVSGNGGSLSLTSGSLAGDRACRWSLGSGLVSLGTLAGKLQSNAYDASGDGGVIVGGSWSSGDQADLRAFSWSELGGMQGLGVLAGGSDSCALSVSADGERVTGFSGSSAGMRAYVWSAAGGMVDLGTLPGHTFSCGAEISGDGATVVGYSGSFEGGTEVHAARWRGGDVRELGITSGFGYSYALATDATGSVIGGGADHDVCGADPRAFVWIEWMGMIDLNEYLPTVGVDLQGWTLREVTGLSDDGSVAVGNGVLDGVQRGWLVTGLTFAPPPACPWQMDGCYSDYDNSDGIDGDDVIAFFDDWDRGLPCADLDASGAVDGDDEILFFGQWDAGGVGSAGC